MTASRAKAPKKPAASLGNKIAETLKERILQWEYPPDYLLGEEVLSQEFAVSRSPVREALRSLEAAGLVRRMPNRGYAVKQVGLAEVRELYDLRLALELHAVETLARTAETRPAVERLRKKWTDIALEGVAGAELARIDQNFHETLVQISGNNTMLEHLVRLNERLFIFRMIDFQKPQRPESTRQQHLTLLDAILAGNVALAREQLRANVEEGSSHVDMTLRDALLRAYERRAGA